MKRLISALIGLALAGSTVGFASAQENTVKGAGKATGEAAKDTGKAAADTTKKAADTTKNAAKKTAKETKKGAKKVGEKANPKTW